MVTGIEGSSGSVKTDEGPGASAVAWVEIAVASYVTELVKYYHTEQQSIEPEWETYGTVSTIVQNWAVKGSILANTRRIRHKDVGASTSRGSSRLRSWHRSGYGKNPLQIGL